MSSVLAYITAAERPGALLVPRRQGDDNDDDAFTPGSRLEDSAKVRLDGWEESGVRIDSRGRWEKGRPEVKAKEFIHVFTRC